MQNNKDKIFKYLNLLLTVALVYFVLVYGKSLVLDSDFSAISQGYGFLILAVLFFFLFYILSSLHWLMVSRIVQKDARSLQVLAFLASQPYKYLPTSFFTFSFRAKFAKKLGLSFRQSTYAQAIENFNILASGAFVGLVFYLVAHFLLVGVLVALIVGSLLIMAMKVKVMWRLPFTEKRIPVGAIVPSFFLMFVAWLIAGVSFIFVNLALGLPVDVWVMIAANAFAYIASILAVFAPGGIGVRELVLSLFMIQPAAVILWRLLTFVSDLVLGFGAVMIINSKIKGEEQSSA